MAWGGGTKRIAFCSDLDLKQMKTKLFDMKKWMQPRALTALLAVALAPMMALGQIVWTEPAFPTQDDQVTLYYDCSLGTGQLVGVIPVYIHTGVITSASTGPADWQHVQTNWGVADANAVMNYEGGTLHSFDFGGQTLAEFYNLNAGEQIESLAMVFRNVTGSLEGKNADGSDIFFAISDGSFTASFLTPEGGTALLNAGETLDVQALASEEAELSLAVNGTEVATASGTALDYTFEAAESGSYTLGLEAVNGAGAVAAAEAVVHVMPATPPTAPAPEGSVDGITYLSDTSVRLQLYAPYKEFVFVVGDFTEWELDLAYLMNQTPDGTRYWIDIEGLTPGQEYRFQYHILPDDIRVADAYSEKVLDPWNDGWIPESTYPDLIPFPAQLTSNEPVSVLQTAQPAFYWTDSGFERPAKEQLIIYELLVRDFTEERTYNAILDTLDYLEDLGINAIELMPVMEFNGNDSWGYNPTFYCALDKAYGTPESFKTLINECHNRGIAVILDIVLNHADLPNPFIKMYWENGAPAPNNPWFNVEAPHALNWFFDFNHESGATKDFTKRVLDYWVDAYHVDGYRLDFSQGMSQTLNGNGSYDQSRINLLLDYGNHVWNQDAGVYMILEHWCDTNEETILTNNGFMVWANATHDYQEAAMGYPSNLNWANYQSHGFTQMGAVSYPESHDEERLMYKNLNYAASSGNYDASNLETALSRMEAIQCFNLPLPGPKMLWQFTELGYDYSINTCSDGVTISDACRVEAKPVRWDYRDNPARYNIHRVIAGLAHLKRNYPTFSSTDFNWDVGGMGKRLLLYHPEMDAVVNANFNTTPIDMVPGFSHTGTWYDYFTGEAIEVTDIFAAQTFAPGEYHVYLDEPVECPVQLVDVREVERHAEALMVWPVPAADHLQFRLDLPAAGPYTLRVLDATGRERFHAGRTAYRSGGITDRISVADWSEGLYFLVVSQGDFQVTERFLKAGE